MPMNMKKENIHANPNNYVTFNNEKAGWRIISINSDGTIKIMKDGNIGDIAWDESNSNNWNRPASLNTYLNNDYYNSLTSTSQSQIVEGTYYAGAVTRGNNDMQDQISDEKAVTSKVKVALPTVSEYLRANSNKEQCGTFSLNNSNYSTCKNSNWMYINDLWWTLSPYSGISGGVFSVNSGGYVNYNFATITNYAVRPAITLSSEVQITGGTGTQSDPYTLGGGVSTAELEKPTYTDEGLFPKTVTIHFPEGCADGSLTCSYQQDNGQSVNVTQTSVELNYEQNGNIVASVSDGVNTVTSSYTVKIELRAVDLSYDNANTGMDCAETQCALDTIKKMLE